MRVRRWLEIVFLLGGLAGVGAWLGSTLTNAVWQSWESWEFDQQVRGESASVMGYLENKVQQLEGIFETKPAQESGVKDTRVARTTPQTIPDDHLLGRLTIPRLDLTATVREGVSESTLGRALGHIPSTALPGHPGNVGVAGHRDTLFRGLRGIKKNDIIQFETVGGTYKYQVESTQIVKPQDVSVLNAAQYPELTLVTCYPFYYVGSAPDRFIVKARQVERTEAQQVAENVSRPTVKKTAFVQEVKEVHKPAVRTVRFSVSMNHSRELVPGISLGLTNTDVPEQRVNGWMWLLSERRTIWLRNHDASEPLVFYGPEDGKRCELRITGVTASSIEGYLVLPN